MQAGYVHSFNGKVWAKIRAEPKANSLTPWSRVLSEKPTVAPVLMNFSTCYGTKVHYHVHKIAPLVHILS
jgi:hypothetical protein